MRFRAALASLLLLAACSSAPPAELPPPELPQRAGIDPIVAARAEGVVFRALGADPDFVLHIFRNNERIFLALDNGQRQEIFTEIRVTLPPYRGTIYEAANERHALRVEVRDAPCRDERIEVTLIMRMLAFTAIFVLALNGTAHAQTSAPFRDSIVNSVDYRFGAVFYNRAGVSLEEYRRDRGIEARAIRFGRT
jgi:hypothetical protein